jgi:HEAT repeat protein
MKNASLCTLALLVLVALPSLGQAAAAHSQTEQALLSLLQSEASLERKADACRQLGQFGSRRAVPALVLLLRDEKLAHYARNALEQIPDSEAVSEAIRQALPALKGRLLAGALMSLGSGRIRGSRSGEDVEKILDRYLRVGDIEVATAAAFGLGRVGTAGTAKRIENALPAAPELLKPALWDAALRCAQTLASQGANAEAIGVYDRLRRSRAPAHIRAAAARGAALARKAAGIPLVLDLLKEREPALFNVGLELARFSPGSKATRAIAAQLPKADPERKALIILALGDRRDRTALPELRSAAVNAAPAARTAAVIALGVIGDESAAPELLQAAAEEDEARSAAAKASLVGLSGSGVDRMLIGAIGEASPARSLAAIECLMRRQSQTAVPALFTAARQGALEVRLAALKALAQLAAVADLSRLVALLINAQSESERDAAEGALTAICGSAGQAEACAQQLVEPMNRAAPEQKKALLRILEAVGGARALQAVRTSLRDEDSGVRDTAVRALSNWPTDDAARDLMDLAQNSPEYTHRILALRAYIRLAEQETTGAEQRLAMLAEAWPLVKRDEEKRLWLGALGNVSSPRALGLIAPLLGDPNVGEEACGAIASVSELLLAKPEQAIPDLKSELATIKDVLARAERQARDEKLRQRILALQLKVGEYQRNK